MNVLTDSDLRFVVSRIPKDVRTTIMNHRVILAGGFIRGTIAGEKISDVDLFVPDKQVAELCAMELALARKGRMHRTDNAITVLSPPRYPVQFITRWVFNSAEEVSASFDFTVCQAAIWFEDKQWRSVCSPEFYPDLAARRLVYTMPKRNEDAGGSMLRVLKYVKRGYSIQAESLAGVVTRMARGVDLAKLSDLEQCDERDVARMFSNILREVDPLTIIDGFDLVDEHEVIS